MWMVGKEGALMTSDFFSKQKRGGKVTSKIENQDSIGVVLSMELMDKDSQFFNLFNVEDPWKIMFEGNDDLEFITNNSRILIQVKTAEIRYKEFIDILDKFKSNYKKIKTKNIFFKICAFNNLKLKDELFVEKLIEYHNSKQAYEEMEVRDCLNELLSNYNIGLEYAEIVDRLHIDVRPLFKDNSDTEAIFAQCLRKAYPIRDFGSKIILFIFEELNRKFAYGRRNRKVILKTDILKVINSNIGVENSFEEICLDCEYEKTKEGYLPSEKARKIIYEVKKSNRRIVREIMKHWRKIYWKEFIKGLIFGFYKCPFCGHPLMANIGGLYGIACPDCGFQPYVTLFLGCSCGHYEVIKSQPALTTEEIINSVLEYIKTRDTSKCPDCNCELIDQYWKYRLVLLPVHDPTKALDLKALYND